MDVDESMVAFWNWTRISLALEEGDVQEESNTIGDDRDDIDSLLICIFALLGAVLTLFVLYR